VPLPFAALLAEGEVVVHGFPEGFLQIRHALALEGNDVARVDDFAVEDAGLVIEFDLSDISLYSIMVSLLLRSGTAASRLSLTPRVQRQTVHPRVGEWVSRIAPDVVDQRGSMGRRAYQLRLRNESRSLFLSGLAHGSRV
jgi:hypothetical protein